jgi:hypothetical protein
MCSRYLTVQHLITLPDYTPLVMLCDFRNYGHITWLYKLWSRYVAAEFMATLSGCNSCGLIT